MCVCIHIYIYICHSVPFCKTQAWAFSSIDFGPQSKPMKPSGIPVSFVTPPSSWQRKRNPWWRDHGGTMALLSFGLRLLLIGSSMFRLPAFFDFAILSELGGASEVHWQNDLDAKLLSLTCECHENQLIH